MRLFSYLNENITRECSEIINFYKKFNFRNFFGRGTNNPVFPDEKIIPRKNRVSSDTPMILHKDINDILYKKFGGFPRSEGVFTTSKLSSAKLYGDPYIFLPSNNFKYIYGKIRDLTALLYDEGVIDSDNDDIYMDIGEAKKEKILKSYTDKNLENALKNDIEVTFKCDYYYLLTEKQFRDII